MGKRVQILLPVFLVAVFGLIVWLMFRLRNPEPSYQGKTLSEWLGQDVRNWEIAYVTPPPSYEAERTVRERARAESAVAIKRIGTNALPFLVKMVTRTDSPLKRKVMGFAGGNVCSRLGVKPPSLYHWRAESGFVILGPEGAPAIPNLVRLLGVHSPTMDANVAQDAGNCLAAIGPAAVPELLPLANDADQELAYYASSALHSIVPRLVYLLGTDENDTNRCRYATELGEIGRADLGATEALTKALEDKCSSGRSAAINALRKLSQKGAARTE